jgi:hypothetical protein
MNITIHYFLRLFVAALVLCPSFLFGQKNYLTKKVIIAVVDGPRYSETWGDTSHQYIPYMAHELAPTGIVCTNFYSEKFTYTTSGHTALCSGHKQRVENSKGSQYPKYPSIFQHYLQSSGLPASKAWIITSKDKLFILGNCMHPDWKNRYQAKFDCGIKGPGSGYRHDSITFKKVMHVLQNDQPNLMLINFREPDYSGHANDWQGYLKGIRDTDSLVWELWKFIQSDPYYKDETTLFVTNDHGRHLDGRKDGFVSHGDQCEGCRHINLFAFGPDFKKGIIENEKFVQEDVPATVAELLNFSMPYGSGRIIQPFFK